MPASQCDQGPLDLQLLHSSFWLLLVRVVLEKDTGISKGYAFCAYFDLANAESAYRNLNGRELSGRPLRLGYAEDYAFRHEDGGGGVGANKGVINNLRLGFE